MPFREAIWLALVQIRAQKLKSFFTLIGVTIGVMFLIAVVSIVQGMVQYVEEDFAGRMLGANTFTVRTYAWFGGESSDSRRRPPVTTDEALHIRSVLSPDMRWAIENQRTIWASSRYAQRPRQVEGRAVDGDYFTIKKYDLSAGRTITQQEYDTGVPVAVIGDEIASFFFPTVGAVGRELVIGNIPFRVVGVIERQGTLFGMSLDKMVIAPYSSPVGRLTGTRNYISGVLVQAPNQVLLNDAMEDVRELLRMSRRLRPAENDNFALETSESALVFLDKLKNIMTIAGTALPALALVIGGLVIMNIMLVAVAERTHEIGIRKSVGARSRDIHRQFLVESATLSTLGALFGIGLGTAGAFVIAWKTPLPAAVAPVWMLIATLLGMGVGIVSGVYPAHRAAHLDPIEALGRE
jgi:putative ABC transport system permease protein